MFTERHHRVIGGWEMGKDIFYFFYNELVKWFYFNFAYFFGRKVLLFAEYEQITPYHQNGYKTLLC